MVRSVRIVKNVSNSGLRALVFRDPIHGIITDFSEMLVRVVCGFVPRQFFELIATAFHSTNLRIRFARFSSAKFSMTNSRLPPAVLPLPINAGTVLHAGEAIPCSGVLSLKPTTRNPIDFPLRFMGA